MGKVELDWGKENASDSDSSILKTDESMLPSDERPSLIKQPPLAKMNSAKIKNTLKAFTAALSTKVEDEKQKNAE